MDLNPLLNKYNALPAFNEIKPEHVKPAIQHIINKYKSTLATLLAENDVYTWTNLIAPLEELDEEYYRITSPVSHLCSVVDSDELTEAKNDCIEMCTDFVTWLAQHTGLYDAIHDISVDQMCNLDEVQQRIVTEWMKGYKLSGIDLPTAEQKRFNEVTKELEKTKSIFSQNCLKSTEGWVKTITDETQLSGIPDYAIEAARDEAERLGKDGWVFTLHNPSTTAILTYADDRDLREEFYRAYITTASDIGPNAGSWDNNDIINNIVSLKTEQAKLLGFDSYAELSIVNKMVTSTEQVFDFLYELVDKSKPAAITEHHELVEFAAQRGVDDLQPWDLPYYIEQMQEVLYSYNDKELREYLPAQNAVNMMMHVASELYGVSFKKVATNSTSHADGCRETGTAINTWHEDVDFYDVFNKDDEKIASFYLDLYARKGKHSGAWMDECVSRRKLPNDSIQLPVTYLNCNFTPPSKNMPSLLSMGEVETVFHEFGHGLHHMLTQVDYSDVSGISGVPWDAVELPSQFMEHFCWDKETLLEMSKHYKTGKKLPDSLLNRVLSARNFRSASAMLRQMEFSLFDFHMYDNYGVHEPTGNYVADVYRQNNDIVAVQSSLKINRFYTTFSHIFDGGYSAGYFSYNWAEVLSSDVFAAFEEHGNIFSRVVGTSFLDTILSRGGSRDFMEMFKEFRGREPSIDALLRHNGIE